MLQAILGGLKAVNGLRNTLQGSSMPQDPSMMQQIGGDARSAVQKFDRNGVAQPQQQPAGLGGGGQWNSVYQFPQQQ